MPLISSQVTTRFTNRTGFARALKDHTDENGKSKDAMNVPSKFLELHQTLSAVNANKTSTAKNDMYFDIGIGQTKNAPEWVKSDWGYHALVLAAAQGGKGITELRAPEQADLSASAAMIPKGSPPPPEAIEFGKTQQTPEASVNEEPKSRKRAG